MITTLQLGSLGRRYKQKTSVPMTWNPADKHADITLSNGDMDARNTASATWRSARGMILSSTVKTYIEYLQVGVGFFCGLADQTHDLNTYIGNTTGGTGGHGYAILTDNGDKYFAATPSSCLLPLGSNDVVMMAFDPVSLKLWFGRTGTWTGNPAAGTGEAFTVNTGYSYYPAMSDIQNTICRMRATAATQAYAAPAGFTPAGDV